MRVPVTTVSRATVFVAVVFRLKAHARKTRRPLVTMKDAIDIDQSLRMKSNDIDRRCRARLSVRWWWSMSTLEPRPRSSRAWLARFILGTGSRFSKDVLTGVHSRELAVKRTEVAVHRSTRRDHDEPEHRAAGCVEQHLPVVACSWTTLNQVLPRGSQFRHGPERDRGEWSAKIRDRWFAGDARDDEERDRHHLGQHLELAHLRRRDHYTLNCRNRTQACHRKLAADNDHH